MVLTTKQMQRLEKKKRKLEALVEITKLNERDKEIKAIRKLNGIQDGLNCEAGDVCTAVKQNASFEQSFSNDVRNTQLESIERYKDECNNDSDPTSNKKPRLSQTEYLQLKAAIRKHGKEQKAIPRLVLRDVGQNASLTFNNTGQDRIPIALRDVQHLLLHSVLGHRTPYLPTRWCTLERYSKIAHSLLLVIDGISLSQYMEHETLFSHITNNLEHRLELITPAAYEGSIIEEIATVPLSRTQSQKLIAKYGSLEAAVDLTGDIIKLLKNVFPMHVAESVKSIHEKQQSMLPSSDHFPRTFLLLSMWQMIEENYPIPLKGELASRYDNYVFTKDAYEEATPRSPMFALDCEMCKTTIGELELTRISVVDENLKIVYESLVKPANRITDYLTRYSGITEEILRDVTTTLADVQKSLRTVLPPDAILIGQSLNCDLHTLKMMHPYIIDTSVIFNITGIRYRKTKLRTLAKEFLGESIQDGRSGHCSTEDSAASMKLTQLKLANSLDYGDAVLQGLTEYEVIPQCSEKKQLFQDALKYATSLFTHITRNTNTASLIGTEEMISEYSLYLKAVSLKLMDDKNFNAKDDQVRLVMTESNEDAIERACQVAMEHAFTLCHVKIERKQLKKKCLGKTLSTINDWVNNLWENLAKNGLMCVVFGGGNDDANGACFVNVKKEVSMKVIMNSEDT